MKHRLHFWWDDAVVDARRQATRCGRRYRVRGWLGGWLVEPAP